MDFIIMKKTAEMLYRMSEGKFENVPMIGYYPQKPDFPGYKIRQKFPRATPESQGISSEYLWKLWREMEEDASIHPHTIMILRNGKVISEGTWYPRKQEVWHSTYSLCKSVMSLGIGMLVDEGRLSLDERVADILKSKTTPLSYLKKKGLLIRHLLTMESGIFFNEAGAVTSTDWGKDYLDSGYRFDPGNGYHYNSMNSYILASVIKEITGMGVMEYLRPRLFEPMGIENVGWETCPKGIEKGGWGMYLCPEDMAKLGQLVLMNGNWTGRQLVSEKWIREMTKKSSDPPESMGKFGYGYQIWMASRPGSSQFNGMMGQNVIIYPDISMVIVTTAGNGESFPNCGFIERFERYFGGTFAPSGELPANFSALERLRRLERTVGCSSIDIKRDSPRFYNGGWGMKKRKDVLPALCRYLDGRTYEMGKTHAGLIPLIMQVVQNHYTKGVTRVGFFIREARFYVELEEGTDSFILEAGFGQAKDQLIDWEGERCLISVLGCCTENEDGIKVLKLTVSFLETPNTRVIKFFFPDDIQVETKWTERPGLEMVVNNLEMLLGGGKSKNMFAPAIASVTESEALQRRLKNMIEPEALGRRMQGEISG